MISRTFAIITTAILAAGAMAGCASTSDGSDSNATTYKVDGSSTVYPIASAWAEEFPREHEGARFSVAFSGTGGGFQKFCRGDIQISDASRPIKSAETEACAANGITPFEIQVAIDALAIVVSKENTWMQDITTAELYRIWSANGTADLGKVARWNELRPEWPNEPIELFGPGTDSGTYDYFVEVVTIPKDGAQGKGRADYTKSEDDNTLVTGVASSPYALGYFGLAYVTENADKVRAVPVDNGKDGGAIAPTSATVEAGTYTPFSRPLFMYVNGKPTGALQQFFQWGIGEEGQSLVEDVGYIPLPTPKQQEVAAKLA